MDTFTAPVADVTILRTVVFSVTKISPAEFTAIPLRRLKRAVVASPSTVPILRPFPAIVDTSPWGVIFLTHK